MRNPGKNIKLFFVKQLQNGVRVIYGCALYTGKYGNYNINFVKVKHNANGKTLSFLTHFRTLAMPLKQETKSQLD